MNERPAPTSRRHKMSGGADITRTGNDPFGDIHDALRKFGLDDLFVRCSAGSTTYDVYFMAGPD